MTYDVESERVIVFGGLTMTSRTSFDLHIDTWAYDSQNNNWTLMSPAQSPSTHGPLAYDAQSDRAIMFLGGDVPPQSFRETWAYDFNTDTWTNMQPETAPPAVLGPTMVYDSESDRMILFSGFDVLNSRPPNHWIFPNSTWAYDFDSNTWTEMNPAVSPPGRNYSAMAYDARADRVILFGSVIAAENPDGFEIVNDTWGYDYNTDAWTALEPAEAPSPRGYSDMVYSDSLKRVIMFGGIYESRGQEDALGDTWVYDVAQNTWKELHPAVSPSERGWHRMAYIPSADRIILFGGGADRQRFDSEIWIYDPNANTWTKAGPWR
jgi:N-acetylneuraminic acid mutarotase